jgi:hypothetical protein
MKKSLFAIALLLVFAAAASAQVNSNIQATTLKAISPAYISLQPTNSPTITFNFTPGTNNANADQKPGVSMAYNLKNSTVTVCAYLAGDLVGTDGGGVIAPGSLNAILPSGTVQFTKTCAGNSNAITVDTIHNATQASGVSESFWLFLAVPGNFPPAPDTYTGTMNIVAQAL